MAIDNSARALVTTLGEDVILTDLKTGKSIGKVEGDGEQISTLACMGNPWSINAIHKTNCD